jgi:predicted nucleic acid-binding protein
MILVDTSLWVHQMQRKGDPLHRKRVETLLLAGEAAWCPMVRLELWAGIGNDRERDMMRDYERILPEFPIDDDAWRLACDLGARCRRAGLAIPSSDLLIMACARRHGVPLEHADEHFRLIETV